MMFKLTPLILPPLLAPSGPAGPRARNRTERSITCKSKGTRLEARLGPHFS